MITPTPVLLPGKSHGWRSLEDCSPWGCWGSDMTEQLHFHFSLSCIGEGNGNPLQRSCLENPRDGGAWWATVYGVAQSRTQLKQLSSSNSIAINVDNPQKHDVGWKFPKIWKYDSVNMEFKIGKMKKNVLSRNTNICYKTAKENKKLMD